MAGRRLGVRVYGLAAVLFGVLAFVFHDFNVWQQIQPLGLVHGREVLLYAVSTVQIAGGLAVQSTRTARAGAVGLAIVYLFFAIMWLPLFAEKPHVFDRLDNFFEEFSMVSGALTVYATTGSHDPGLGTRLGLAAIALLTRRLALPAARLLTAMIAGFGLLVWLPALFAHPHSYLAWAGNAENGGIGGAAWIIAAYLAKG